MSLTQDKIDALIASHPLIQSLVKLEEVSWFNPAITPSSTAAGMTKVGLGPEDIQDASKRLSRFAAYLRKAFPETEASGGIIESVVRPIPKMQQALNERYGLNLKGKLWLKQDSHLPISGSIKARGGIYEVLKHAEDLAIKAGLLKYDDDYAKLFSDEFRKFFSQYSIAVGSTGNLGLSIGIMSAKLGFKVAPLPEETRYDLIQTIYLENEENMCRFCQGIQSFSPVDAHVTPIPDDMPGYADKIIMAAGDFVQGSSIELSADGPIRDPYMIYLQGGIVFEHNVLAVLSAAQYICEYAEGGSHD